MYLPFLMFTNHLNNSLEIQLTILQYKQNGALSNSV